MSLQIPYPLPSVSRLRGRSAWSFSHSVDFARKLLKFLDRTDGFIRDRDTALREKINISKAQTETVVQPALFFCPTENDDYLDIQILGYPSKNPEAASWFALGRENTTLQ